MGAHGDESGGSVRPGADGGGRGTGTGPAADSIALAFQRGWGGALVPLHGKVPALDSWTTAPPATEQQVRAWVEEGFNLGLRTGAASGLVAIDDDQGRHDVADRWVPPPTDLIAESPTGGRHYLYRDPGGIGNSANRLAPFVDVRGEGGQVVYPGSAHPVTRTPYRWVSTGEPGTLPEALLARLREAPTLDLARPTPPAPAPSGAGYVGTALHREVHAVRTAGEGSRNETLNRAAFNLGTLVASGALDRTTVEAELTAAAAVCGLPAGEAQATIRSGLAGGARHPRAVPERPERQRATAPSAPRAEQPAPAARAHVLVPGSHNLPPDGEYQEQGNHAFAAAVLAGLPHGTLYRRAGVIGQITPGTDADTQPAFQPVTPDALRSLVDEHMRLGAGKAASETNLDGTPIYSIVYRNCLRDHASVILAYAETARGVRELRHLATHPVVLGADFRVAQPGWNAAEGVYLAVDHVPEPLDLDTSRAVLADLVCDFPFQSDADRANFFGLMLTPLLRPAIREPVPMHLINSPIERSGKTKLAEIVLGCSVLGHTTPAMQLGEREDEREKRIMATLVEGRTVLHLDNLTEFLSSASLSSLLTSSTYVGRILGSTRNVAVRNTLTIVGTGNNVHATGEVAKRIVPIRLMPPTESPETRQDYRHPLLREYVEAQRPRVLGALLGLLEAWRAAGRPLGSVGFGGFERWSAVLGGIMRTAGYPEWLSNLPEWRESADDFSAEVTALCTAWHEKWACEWVPASSVYDLAVLLGIFGWLDKAKTERGKRTSFGMRVLNRVRGRAVLGRLMVEVDGVGEARRVRLAHRV